MSWKLPSLPAPGAQGNTRHGGKLCGRFAVKTLERHQFREFLPYPKDRRQLPTVLSPEEVARLIKAAGHATLRVGPSQGERD